MRLLLIEDLEKVSRFIVKGLMAERFAVDVAAEGDKGLEMARTYAHANTPFFALALVAGSNT